MVKFAIGFVLFVLVLSGSRAYGQVCTAYLNASDGDDGNQGTQTSPLRSIEFAYSTLAAESVVCVAAGEYFFGDDADGISLSTDGKGMTFVLNAFAGEDEIRFSESFLEVNVGTAKIIFLQGSTSKLILGEGIANTNDPASPNLLNFLHTFSLVSGSVDISDIDVTIEASVGAPSFVNPLNPAKIAPADARIEYGDVQITGNLIFEPAARTILFSPSSPTVLNYPLPSNLSKNRLIFSNLSVLTASVPLAIQDGTMIFRNTGSVTFENAVSLDPKNGSILLESGSGDVQFTDILSFQGSQITGSLIQHSGSGRLTINTLQLIFDGIGSDAETSLRIDSDGEMEIIAIEQLASTDGSKLIANLIVDRGTLRLGSPSQIVKLPGALINRDNVELNGPAELGENGLGTSLDNSGSLSVKSFRLSDTGSETTAKIDGLISGTANGVVEIAGTSSWTGSGTLPGLDISGTGIFGGTLFADGAVTVRSGARLELTSTSILTASGSVLGEASATVVLLSEATLITSDDVSFSSGTITLSENSRLVAEGNVDVGNASFQDRSGWIEFVGTDSRSLSGSGTLNLPGIFIKGAEVHLADSANIRELSIAGGSLSIVNKANLTVSGNTSVTSGTIVTPSAGTIEFNGPVSLSSGTLDFSSAGLVRFLSDADWQSGTVVFSNGGVEFAGDQSQTLIPSPGSLFPRLTIVGMSTRLNVTGGITVEDDLSLDEGTLALASGITVSLNGNLTRTNGVLEHELGTEIHIIGTGARHILGFTENDLPSLRISGPDVTPDGDVTITGSLIVDDGSFRVRDGSAIDVTEQIQLLHGSITVESDATLRSGHDVELSGGTFSLSETSTLDLGSNLTIGGTAFMGNDAVLNFSGAKEQSFSPGSMLQIGELVTSGLGTKVSIVGPEGIAIGRRLVVGPGTEFDIGNVDVIFSGELPVPGMHVDGTAKSNSGIFKFIGPTLQTAQYLLSGGGVFGSIMVSLTFDSDHILVSGLSQNFRFSGEIYFQSGSINVAGKSIVPSTSQALPGIRRNLQDEIGPPGNLDGGGFFDSTGPLVFNPDGVTYDLTYEGSLSTFYVMGPEFQSGVVRNLDVRVIDEINSPPVFGVLLDEDARIRGSLSIGERALLRLNNVDLSLPLERSSHLINGSVTGGGRLILEGDGASLVSLSGTGSLGSVQLANLEPSNPISISGILSIDRLDVSSGGGIISPPVPGGADLLIRKELTLTGGSLEIARPINIGVLPAASRVILSAGELRINEEVNVHLSPGIALAVSEGATVSVSSIGPGGIMSGGFFIFEGTGTIETASPIPRVRLAYNPALSSLDDLFLSGHTHISEALIINGGDIHLGPWNLTLSGGLFRLDNTRGPLDDTDALYGDPASDAGELIISGSTTFELAQQDLVMHASSLRIAPSEFDEVELVSMDDSPHAIIIRDQRLLLENGTLHLGLNDIVLGGDIDGVFTATGGMLTADSNGSVPAKEIPSGISPELFPVHDEQYGEIVLEGAPNASLRVTEGFSIPNLTVRGAAQIAADSQPLTIDGRLVFGRNGTVFFLGDTNRLLLSDGAVVLRRGGGSLSHAPTALGSLDVFYDLDDGSHSNVDSGFGPGVLQSGFELSAISSAIRNFGVMAGGRNGTRNSLRIESDLHVTGAFTLFSGTIDLGFARLSFDQGASFSINEIDSDAPTQLLSATGYSSTGPIDVSFVIKDRNFTTDELVLPSSLSIRAFRVDLGEEGAPFSPNFFMHRGFSAEEFEFTAVSSVSALNLLGHSLDIQGDIRIGGGTLTSNEMAEVHSSGHFLLRSGSRVEEAISLSVEGDATIDGFFDGRGIDITGNLSLPGEFGSGVRLRFVGQNQEFRSIRDVSIWQLILEQEDGSVDEPSKVTLETSGEAFDLIIGSNLVLSSGVLSTGANRLVLPGSVTGFSRNPLPGNPSHVEGSIARIALFGTETFVFPLGDDRNYRPLTAVFVDPLLTSTQLTARHAGAPPFGTNGLPLDEAGEPTIRSTVPFVWSISSSTDLLPIQSVDVRVQFDPSGLGDAEDLRIIARPHSLIVEPWAFLSSANLAMDVSGQLELTAARSDLDLNTRGIDFTIGLPVAAASDAAVQFVHSYPHNPVDEVRLEIDGYEFGETFTFNTASRTFPVALQSTEPEHHRVILREGATGEVMVETSVALAPDGRTVVAFVSTPAGDKTIVSTIVPSFGSVPITDLGLGFVNASTDFPIDHVELNDSGSPLFAGAEVGSIFPPVIARPEYTVIQFIQQNGVDIPDRFAFDFTPLGGRTPMLLLSGYLDAPQFAGPEKYLELSVLLSDGSILATTPVTHSDALDEPTEIPREFIIHGNYPNPFNPVTTLLFDLPDVADIRLTVVDMLGRVVFSKEYENMLPGNGSTIEFNASRLASGTYLYRIDARTRGSLLSGTGKMIVLK